MAADDVLATDDEAWTGHRVDRPDSLPHTAALGCVWRGVRPSRRDGVMSVRTWGVRDAAVDLIVQRFIVMTVDGGPMPEHKPEPAF